MTIYDTDLSTQTMAAAWASSPFGQPGEALDATDTEDTVTETAGPTATRAAFAAAVLGAVALGSVVGVGLYLYTDSEAIQPTAVVPGSAESVVPAAPASIPQPSSAPETLVVAPAQAPAPAKPHPVVRAPESPVAAPANDGQADVASPPTDAPADTTVVIDIPIPTPPSYPPLVPPSPPEPPSWQPPQVDKPKFQPPQPDLPDPPLPPKMPPILGQ